MRTAWMTPHGAAMLVAALALLAGAVAWFAGLCAAGGGALGRRCRTRPGAADARDRPPAAQARARRRHHRRPGHGRCPGAGRDPGRRRDRADVHRRQRARGVRPTAGEPRAHRPARPAPRGSPTARPVPGSRTWPVEEVRVGDTLLVKSGEVLPVDGRLLDATAAVDESALTGEALPVDHRRGAALRSGTVNAGGPLRLRAERHGRRQHLFGHRPPGRGGAAGEGALRAARRPVVAGLPRPDPRDRRARLSPDG